MIPDAARASQSFLPYPLPECQAANAHALRRHGDVKPPIYSDVTEETVIPGPGVAQDGRVGGGASRPFYVL